MVHVVSLDAIYTDEWMPHAAEHSQMPLSMCIGTPVLRY